MTEPKKVTEVVIDGTGWWNSGYIRIERTPEVKTYQLKANYTVEIDELDDPQNAQ